MIANRPAAPRPGYEVKRQRFAMAPTMTFVRRLYDILVLDVSGSMKNKGFERGKRKLDLIVEALLLYLVAKLARRPNDEVALVAFSDDATLCCPFLLVDSCYEQLRSAVMLLNELPHRGTCMASGLQIAHNLFRQVQQDLSVRNIGECEDSLCRVIAYSDGYDGYRNHAIDLAAGLKESGVHISTFGLGRNPKDVDEAFLKTVATRDADGPAHRFLGDAETVRTTFARLGEGVLTVED